MNPSDWLVKWFVHKSHISQDEITHNLDENFMLKGWIDSLMFISFITDIEQEFKIKFSNDEFQNREFATIKGLSKIIEKKIGQ